MPADEKKKIAEQKFEEMLKSKPMNYLKVKVKAIKIVD